ncbi:MAG: hypothetical protein IPF73_14985 [Betaproteobacteria bacterium]|nr:hypothetical protein [Betaproteobacteria bacterium]
MNKRKHHHRRNRNRKIDMLTHANHRPSIVVRSNPPSTTAYQVFVKRELSAPDDRNSGIDGPDQQQLGHDRLRNRIAESIADSNEGRKSRQ